MSIYKFTLVSFVWFLKLTKQHLFIYKSLKNPRNGKYYKFEVSLIYRNWYIYKERMKDKPTTYRTLAKKFNRSDNMICLNFAKTLRRIRGVHKFGLKFCGITIIRKSKGK